MARVIDLTHTITSGMPVYPGDPEVFLRSFRDESGAYQLSLLHTGSHAGTHADAPAHRLPGGRGLSEIPPSAYIGFHAAVLDFTSLPPERVIDALRLRAMLPPGLFVDSLLLHTGWDRFWGDPRYFAAHPGLSADCAEFLSARGIFLIGLDTPSVSHTLHEEVHESLLSRGIVIVENLCALSEIKAPVVEFHAVPLKISGGDGSPVRAYVMER